MSEIDRMTKIAGWMVMFMLSLALFQFLTYTPEIPETKPIIIETTVDEYRDFKEYPAQPTPQKSYKPYIQPEITDPGLDELVQLGEDLQAEYEG